MVIKSLAIFVVVSLLLLVANTTPIIAQPAVPAPTKLWYDSTTNDLAPVWSADGLSVLITKALYPADKAYKTQFFEITLGSPDQPRLILEIDGMIYGAVWSPDRQRIAYVKDRSVFVQDRSGNMLIQVMGGKSLWSPDGTRLLVWTPQGLVVVGVDDRTTIQLTHTAPTDAMYWSGTAWSPNGQQIVVSMDDDLYLFDVQTGASSNLTHSDGSESQPAWSPDGAWIAFTSSASYESLPAQREVNASPIYIIKPDGSKLGRVSGTRGNDACPAWSPDGQSIAFMRGGNPDSGTLFVLDLTTLVASWLDRPDGNASQCPQWSPDSQSLLFQAVPFEGQTGITIYIAPHTALKTDVLSATLINRVAFLTANDQPAIHVRSAPTDDSDTIATLSDGVLFQILGTQQANNGDTWVHITYQGAQTGWIRQAALVYVARNLDPTIFCDDLRPRELIAALQAAVSKRDGDALARLVAPSGLYMSFGSRTLHLSLSEVQNLFNDHMVRDWGVDANSGAPILKSLADDAVALLVSDLTPATVSLECNDNQDALSGRGELYHLNIEHYTINNFYSVMRPGAVGNELDWGAWGIAIQYWDGHPVVLGLTTYHWTP